MPGRPFAVGGPSKNTNGFLPGFERAMAFFWMSAARQ